MALYAFLSYQHSQRTVAAEIRDILTKMGIDSFMAHEDIEVSEEWRIRILEELSKADLFVCVLSEDFYRSAWCVQESGIAAFRGSITIIPLSIDENVSKGFISHLQSTKVKPGYIAREHLIPGVVKHDFKQGIDIVLNIVRESYSFREAEANFRLILPYTDKLTTRQVKTLLEIVRNNDQIHHAKLCAKEYIPPLLNSYGRLLAPKDLKFLKDVCRKYE